MSIREEHEIWMKYIQTLFAATFDEGQYYSEFLHERAKPHIGSVTDYYGGFFRRFLRRQVATLVSIKERVSLLDEPAAIVSDNNAAPTSVVSARNVFIVHGRDRGVRETVARFVEHLGLHAVILDEIPNLGRTVVEKFEQAAAEHNVRYAIVLMTPDDVGALAIEVDESSPRARQNVIFELGYFIGKLGRGNVCPLVKGDVEIPSDFYGVVYVPLDDFDGWKSKLKSEMEAVGLPIHEAS
ncbi:MAG: hypothetical protein F4X57_13785 [Chloroflexi bacterium]|nr:hypothetical protein [Chloroflexota bacterium]